MNSSTNSNDKILGRFLVLIMFFSISCDDIFVNDISTSIIQLNTPSSGWQSKEHEVSFRWESVPDAVNYQLEVVTPGFSVNHRLVFEKLLDTSKFDTILPAGSYEWRIKAINPASETDYFSSAFTILSPFNIAAKQVTLKIPEDQFVSNVSDVHFSWDAIEGANFYSFKIKKVNWVGDSVIVAKLYSTNFNFRLEDGTYAWGVAAIDTSTNKKTDFTIRSFTIDKNPPSVPELVSPTNRDTIDLFTLAFNWRKTEPNASYSIEIYSDPGLKNRVIERTVSDTATFINLEKVGYYFWNVKSIDQNGNSSKYSTVSSFCIQLPTNVDQTKLTLMSPANNSLVIDKKVTFWWNLVNGAERYNLQIVSPTFSNPIKLISDQWITTNSIAVELEPGNYEWRVKAATRTSETNYSQSSFSIYNNDLSKQKTTLLKPQSAELTNKSLLKFSWDRLNSTAIYHFLIKKGSWETGSVIQEISTTKTEIELPVNDGEYFWGVKAIDPQNSSETDYSVRNFMVDQTTPEVPELKAPANNLATGDFFINFSWESLDESESKLTYTFEIYKMTSSSHSLLATKTTQQKAIGYNFETAGKYKWRVCARDNAGNTSSFTEFRYFEITIVMVKNLSETVVSLVTPADKCTLIDRSVTFWWSSIIGAEKYNIQIVSPSFENPLKLISDQWITSNSIAIDLEPGNYQWRVKAANSSSESGYSLFSFSIYDNDMTKQKLTLLKPLYAESSNIPNVKFSWEKLNSNVSYHLLVSKDGWETGNIVQELNTNKTEIELTFLDGEYYWGVKATDPLNGSETVYSTRKFMIDLVVPEIPKLKYPVNNLISTDYSIDFSWEPGDAADTKLTYTLEIYRGIDSGAYQLTFKKTTQKTLGYNFDSVGKYKWRVYATDSAGNQGAFSEYRYFEIK
jgi:hypothetical protein